MQCTIVSLVRFWRDSKCMHRTEFKWIYSNETHGTSERDSDYNYDNAIL